MAEDEEGGLRSGVKNVPQQSPISQSTNVSETLSSDLKFKDNFLKIPGRVKPSLFNVVPGYQDKYNPEATERLRTMKHYGDADSIRSPLEQGADPNKFDVLSKAIRLHKTGIARLLLEKGADSNKADLDELRDTWNTYVLKSNTTGKGKRPIFMYHLPQLYHIEDQLCLIDETDILICEAETVPKISTCVDETVLELCNLLMEENNLSKPSDVNDARHLYVRLRRLIRSGLDNL